MNSSYTWSLTRKILLVFLTLTVFSSIAALIVRDRITRKLEYLTKLTNHAERDQSKPEHALLLLHLAENDFQESLLNANRKKSNDYKSKLSLAFKEIDTLLKENIDTAHLSTAQKKNAKIWYLKKIKLSGDLFVLKHNFDSLLTCYAGFNSMMDANLQKIDKQQPNGPKVKDEITIVRKVDADQKKGLIGRLKDAIINKNTKTVTEIDRTHSRLASDQVAQKILFQNKHAYLKQLQQLQQQNVKLLNMQRDLTSLNTSINNELGRIINDLKDINYQIADQFKAAAFKNYQETTGLLNAFCLTALFLVLLFAMLLIVFVIQLNRAEMALRKESDDTIQTAHQKIEELIKKIELTEDNRSPQKMEDLKEIVQLAVNNNPAYLVKFNDYDPGFNKKLLDIAPTLVAAEMEFCVLLRLNFETKEIARYTKTSVRAVEGRKYRIRRKLNIPSEQDINIWMTSV